MLFQMRRTGVVMPMCAASDTNLFGGFLCHFFVNLGLSLLLNGFLVEVPRKFQAILGRFGRGNQFPCLVGRHNRPILHRRVTVGRP